MDDIDSLVAEELDAKASKLWEQGVREALGDAEFERLYPESHDCGEDTCVCAT